MIQDAGPGMFSFFDRLMIASVGVFLAALSILPQKDLYVEMEVQALGAGISLNSRCTSSMQLDLCGFLLLRNFVGVAAGEAQHAGSWYLNCSHSQLRFLISYSSGMGIQFSSWLCISKLSSFRIQKYLSPKRQNSSQFHQKHPFWVSTSASFTFILLSPNSTSLRAINAPSWQIGLFITSMISKAQYALFVIAITSLTLFANWHYQSQETLPTADMNCGFTQDFANFIQNNGYSPWQFDRPDLKCASYGGRATAKEKIKNIPVIFIHGNSDIGFGRGSTDGYLSWQTGFTQLATFLAAQGYQKSEMYTTTYGPANPNLASQNYHSKKYVTQIRAFVQAVLAYTGAPLVNIIGHSMGVTIGRKVIKGGSATDHMEGNYNLGPSLKDRVKTFVGLAGANLGLNQCYASSALPTCGVNEGFYPGLFSYSGPSKYLEDLNVNGGPEATNVYTIWSKFDDLIQSECLVWGKVTCRITGQTAQVIKNSIDWNHFAVRDKTGPDLFKWL